VALCGAEGRLCVTSPLRIMFKGNTQVLLASLDVAAQADGSPELHLGGGDAEILQLLAPETGVDVAAAAALHPLQALHRCEWGPEGGGAERLLACAGAAGLLRVLRVRLPASEEEDAAERLTQLGEDD
jgi:hypothetical protein